MIATSNIEQKVQVATKVYYLLWNGIERQNFTQALCRDIAPKAAMQISPTFGSPAPLSFAGSRRH